MNKLSLLAILLMGLLLSCSKDKVNPNEVVVTNLQVTLNPSSFAPLTAMLSFTTDKSVSVRLRVAGQNGSASDVVHDFPMMGQAFEIPVLGLYPDAENEVEVIFLSSDGTVLDSETVSIATKPLISDMPEITINTAEEATMQNGFNFVNYFGHNSQGRPQRPFMFDAYGDIRWYLDYSEHPTLSNLFYDNGMSRLANGNLIFGDGNSGTLYEIDMLGEIVNSWSLQGFGFHHHVIEKPDGNFLVTVNDPNKETVEDVILEIDRNAGTIVNTWDLNESLDNTRRAWPTDLADLNVDWFHANALAYDVENDAIIVSGRTQGLVKLTADNEPIWILAPHRDWQTSGRGDDLNQFLLQPLDAQGAAITDEQVLDGEINHPDFEWSWYQHSPILLPDGHLMLFDNGDNRNYSFTDFSNSNAYSRVVEYNIDEANKTIQQVWSYGKDRRGETFSRIVSKVFYLEEQDHVLFAPGAVVNNGDVNGKVIEINRLSGEVVFEATIIPPMPFFNITFHSVLRFPIYGK